MPLTMAIEVTATFADTFFELLATQQYVQLGRMFLVDPSSDHFSTLTLVDASGCLSVFHASEITSALTSIFAPVARKHIVIEDISAVTVNSGVSGTITFGSEALVGTVCVLLEHCDDETYFVRNLTVRVESVAAVVTSQVVEVPVVVEDVAPVVQAAVVEAPHVVEEAAPAAAAVETVAVVSPPSKGKGKGKKAKPTPTEEPATVSTAIPEPEAPVAAEPEPVVEAPAVVEVAAPEPEVVAPAPPVPSAPKSWATLARKPAAPAAPAAPVVVRPPSAQPVAEPAPVAPVKEAKEVKEPRQPKPEIKDRLMFNIAAEVTDDEVKAALGNLAKSVVNLRNQSKNNRVFIDFSVDTAFDTLASATIKIREQPLKFQRQHIKASA